MNKITIWLYTGLLFFYALSLSAQDQKAEQIVKAVGDYFFLDRENIHVQMDKSIFFTNEDVWFKGYIYHRKKNQPFFTTINVYAALIDDTGKVIDTKLLYGNLGSFVGNFNLNSSFKSGRYYIQYYTNWMNNFAEDESFTKEITIINEKDNAANALRKKLYSELKINIVPEGGTYVKGIANNFGINITACDGTPAPVTSIDIIGINSKTITKVQLNKLGNGRLELPANAEPAKAVVILNEKPFEVPFPRPSVNGFALAVNNYSMQGNAVIAITTNESTASGYTGKPLYLIIHHDDKVSVFNINFDRTTTRHTLVIPPKEMFEGLSTIRLLDENLKELAVRMLYNYPSAAITTDILPVKQTERGLRFSGHTTPNMNLSIAVLPDNTKSADDTNDIYGSMLISPYIKSDHIPAGRHYFTTLTRGRHYELDIFLISQQPKHSWFNILNNPPKEVFTFDMGIVLKGKVPPGISYGKKDKIQMVALGGISEYVSIDDNREFELDHLVIQDSAWVKFSLARIKDNSRTPMSIIPQTSKTGTQYFKMYKPVPECDLEPAKNTDEQYAPTLFKDAVVLETVTVERKLKYSTSFGNTNLTGYKVSDYNMGNGSILGWIRAYSSFDVVDNITSVSITSRVRNTINAAPSSPVVYIDNVRQIDLTILSNILIDDVDEVYMNTHVLIPSMQNNFGIIKIYLKKGVRKAKNSSSNVPDIVVKNGFQRYRNFKNISYASTSDKAYENFGVVMWHSVIVADEKGNFTFEIPRTGQTTVRLLIEGLSPDGKMISEIKTVSTQ